MSVTILAGKLNKRVVIQQRSDVADGGGGSTATWSTLATVWASIATPKAHEVTQAQQRQQVATHVVEMRYRTDVTHAMRLLYGTRVFNILGISNPEEANVLLHLICQEDT